MRRLIIAVLVGAALGLLLASIPAVRETVVLVITGVMTKPGWDEETATRPTVSFEQQIPYAGALLGAGAGGIAAAVAFLSARLRRRAKGASAAGGP
ncbi:MAG TPA: hypothetical protein VFW33_04920, partial [Gemmataceae bacterium]|nr:hypothetical protein [Gemmataceae bacterium]